MKNTNTEIPAEVRTNQLARLLGINQRTINTLVREGKCEFSSSKTNRFGYWNLVESIAAYLEYREDVVGRRAVPDEDPWKIERVRKAKLENDQTERQLIQMDEALEALTAIIGPIQEEYSTIAPQASDDLTVRRAIEAEVDRVSNALADRFEKSCKILLGGGDQYEEVVSE